LPPVDSLLVSDTPGTLIMLLSPTIVWGLFSGDVPATTVAVTGSSAAPGSSSVTATSGSTTSSSTASRSAAGSIIKSDGLKLAQ